MLHHRHGVLCAWCDERAAAALEFVSHRWCWLLTTSKVQLHAIMGIGASLEAAPPSAERGRVSE